MSFDYIQLFYNGLLEFFDILLRYFQEIGSFTTEEFTNFMFMSNFKFDIASGLTNKVQTFYGVRNIINQCLVYLDSFTFIGDIIIILIERIIDIFSFTFGFLFRPIYIPTGFNASTCPFFYSFMSGVLMISIVSGMITFTFKIFRSFFTFYQ